MAAQLLERPAEPQALAPAASDDATLLEVIRRAAEDPNVDIEKLERLIAMQERIEARRAEVAYNVAMSEAQAAMTPIREDATNSETKSKYASYLALDRAVRPIYTQHGFSISFDCGDGAPENHVRVLGHVSHREGHTRTYRADLPADGKDTNGRDVMTRTHATGSAFTYGRRYLLALTFNLAIGELLDDDGNGASASMRITAEQKAELLALIKKTNANRAAFLKYMRLPSLEEMPLSLFDRAIAALEKKKRSA
jgi:hypothetical protein